MEPESEPFDSDVEPESLELDSLELESESELFEPEPELLLDSLSELFEPLSSELELFELDPESALLVLVAFELEPVSEPWELEPPSEDVTFDSDLVKEPPPEEPESFEEL